MLLADKVAMSNLQGQLCAEVWTAYVFLLTGEVRGREEGGICTLVCGKKMVYERTQSMFKAVKEN